MHKSKIIIANWKSNKTLKECKLWLDTFGEEYSGVSNVIALLAPPFPLLGFLQDHELVKSGVVRLAAQDCSQFPRGKYTGGVAADILSSCGVSHVIVGHSERRRNFNETHAEVGQKVSRILEAGMIPVVCVDDEYVAEQAAVIDSEDRSRCIVAYEELGSIGTGHAQSATHVEEIVQRIHSVFEPLAVLYGGSVDSKNIFEFMKIADGALVGTASLDAREFSELVKNASLT